MKLGKAKTNYIEKPFVDDGNIKIIVVTQKNKVTSFKAELQGKKKEFVVKNWNILAAWKQVEKFFSQLNVKLHEEN